MNKAITEGLALMPPAFVSGLDLWSSEDGTPGSAPYDGAANAALVTADADFGGCLELVKTETVTKLRYMGETPLQPGMYLRIKARIKAVSGNLPSVRIAGWAGDGALSHVSGVTETGSEVALTQYGEVVEVSAIVGSGARSGVDMPWGLDAVYGHFGLDLTGANGGTVRIDDIEIEDVSAWFLSDSSGVIDVRDYGAVGDGATDCQAAFNAANAAAAGRKILVPEGEYYLSGTVSFTEEVVFDGTVLMPQEARLVLRHDFHLNAYIDAFGDEVEGFKRAIQAMFYYTDHDSLDMRGRRIELYAPLDIAEISGADTLEVRRVIRNGQINVQSSTDWDTEEVISQASYNAANPRTLTNVSNIANIKVGSLVTGTGVGREVYVESVNVGNQSLTLNHPLYGPNATQSYTFTRFKYVFDFSGLSKLSQFQLFDVELLCNGRASGVMLAPGGNNFHLRDCHIKSPLNRGVTSIGGGCQDLHIDRCAFVSNEQSLRAEERQSVAFNVNANDAKIRDNRFQRFGHTGVVYGNGHMFVGNHWFQGDDFPDSPRKAGLVFTYPNVKSAITGNYIDNSFIEMTNEHDATPDFAAEYSFGGLTITGNIFTVNDSASAFSWIVIKPYGSGHFLQGLAVQNNTFKSLNGFIERVERVDTTFADLEYNSSRNVTFEGNSFNGVSQNTINPVSLEFTQNTASTSWVLDPSGYLPFGGWARVVESVVFRNALTDASDNAVFTTPYATVNYGAGSNQILLSFEEAVKGTVNLVTRMDRPI
ncbi:glycosyl hydrolase family 28-related protein [Celeribacter halophilus]|uniref:Pectate lyase superfamily protein n=1 Tax=Celeribacter halophilus TaxID=576117 RepID=A0A1I3WK54_9RHOB|nr:glycosyl hydrolase family 28-related protein [Celeribacter halophilus]PZX06106.1 pectate lyase-like protein [Celeribacter halophilus]SFK07553.1 Pectate lyase superfamily protein [Celeribacter halophilus]